MKTTMKKSVARVIILTLVLAMMMSFAVPAMAAEESKVKAAEGFDDVRNGVFKFYQTWQNEKDAMGTAFLINEDHIITAGHCVSESELLKELAGVTGKVEEEYNKNVGYEVAIRRDVTIKAELVTYSENMDFAILKLAQPVATRKYLTLRDSSELKAGDLVWNVGFPVFHEGQTFDNDYTPSGVTVKPGSVMKTEALTEFVTTSGAHFKGMAISTNVELSGGDSGGPMIDKDGYVVGVSIVSVTGADKADSFYQATSINQVIDLCNDLGIKYYMKGETPEPEVKETVAPTEDAAKAAAEAEAKAAAEAEAKAAAEAEAKAAAEAAAAAAAAENAAKAEENTKKDGGMNLTIILIIAAVAVVAVIVVIVVVLGKKKPAPVSAPANVGAGQTAGFQTNSYTQPMGAGETTVLGGGAGETTILGRSTNGGSLIRKRTNETIVINTDRFVIGRERKTSNYCVADNSSVSRSHVTLSVRGGTTFLMDMNAANGTYVNGVKVMPNQEVALKNGDRIKLSDEEFEFRA